MKRSFGLAAVMVLLLGVASCIDDKEDNSQQLLVDQIAAIDVHLTKNNSGMVVRDINGIRMDIRKLGTGFPAKETSSVNVKYVGKLFEDNSEFDRGTINQALSGLIKGWQIALISLPEGSIADVYIPSQWAYGPAGQGSIPGNAILKFELEFNKVNRTSVDLQKFASDTLAIDAYLEEKNIDAVKDSTGLRYVITTPGTTGPKPKLYDQVSFHIVFKLLTADDKAIVDTDVAPSVNNFNRVVDQYADGLKHGLQQLQKGGKATFYVPSLLGYGTNEIKSNGAVLIPANSNLIMEVELDEIGAQ
jgi:FKBP-type peptidyl-prolyl cis-trans isomerase